MRACAWVCIRAMWSSSKWPPPQTGWLYFSSVLCHKRDINTLLHKSACFFHSITTVFGGCFFFSSLNSTHTLRSSPTSSCTSSYCTSSSSSWQPDFSDKSTIFWSWKIVVASGEIRCCAVLISLFFCLFVSCQKVTVARSVLDPSH